MELDGVTYYAADANGATEFCGDAIINFTKTSNFPTVAMIPALADHVNIGFDEEIMVPWPDYGTPGVFPSFWKALHEFVISQGWKKVCFHCAAGHGRTGTGLSAMLVANAGYTAIEAVELVREQHCDEAVESMAQCTYLQVVDQYYNDREPTVENRPVSSSSFTRVAQSRQVMYPYYDRYSNNNDSDEKEKEDEFGYDFVDDEDETGYEFDDADEEALRELGYEFDDFGEDEEEEEDPEEMYEGFSGVRPNKRKL